MVWVSAGASVLSGLLGSSSANKAAKQQAAAAREQLALQTRIYDEDVKRNQPAIDAGNLGRNKLMELLGLGGTAGGRPAQSRDQLRQSLQGRFTTQGKAEPIYGPGSYESGEGWANGVRIPIGFGPTTNTVDENGLQSAIDAEMARGGGTDSNSADYGSLMRDFTGADLQSEPGYQFGLSEGQKGLDRKAASAGGYFSGAALKAAQRFGQDYAGMKYNEAFNRDTSNKTNKFNRLQGLIGGGQVAANQQQASGANYAGGAGGVMSGNANAQGAASIAQGNAWQGAANGLSNAFQDYNAQNRLRLKPGSGYGGYRAPTGDWQTGGFGGEY